MHVSIRVNPIILSHTLSEQGWDTRTKNRNVLDFLKIRNLTLWLGNRDGMVSPAFFFFLREATGEDEEGRKELEPIGFHHPGTRIAYVGIWPPAWTHSLFIEKRYFWGRRKCLRRNAPSVAMMPMSVGFPLPLIWLMGTGRKSGSAVPYMMLFPGSDIITLGVSEVMLWFLCKILQQIQLQIIKFCPQTRESPSTWWCQFLV